MLYFDHREEFFLKGSTSRLYKTTVMIDLELSYVEDYGASAKLATLGDQITC